MKAFFIRVFDKLMITFPFLYVTIINLFFGSIGLVAIAICGFIVKKTVYKALITVYPSLRRYIVEIVYFFIPLSLLIIAIVVFEIMVFNFSYHAIRDAIVWNRDNYSFFRKAVIVVYRTVIFAGSLHMAYEVLLYFYLGVAFSSIS
jgi:hypothetical protein